MPSADLIVVGAGAAGLAAAIFAARANGTLRVVCLDGARSIGAKILVSGGSRCNVTNRAVTERDFWGGSARVVKAVLRAFPAERAAAFFEEIGVALHEEEDGKLFPDTNRSRTVLDALLAECGRLGVAILPAQRVDDVVREEHGFRVLAAGAAHRARAVVLATGGRSLPRSGSDGFGYELARRLGHGYVETTPALAPLVLGDGDHARLSGVSHPATLVVRAGASTSTLTGPLLWTHFGVSGPVALNASRHWHRADMEGRRPRVTMNLLPGETFDSLEGWVIEMARTRPRTSVENLLARRLPAAVASAWVDATLAPRGGATPVAQLPRDARRVLVRALIGAPLDVRGSRGYGHAEVTAGGVPLDEIDPATMESRVCPGLYLVGEILDADGRLGGFNFQWAWATGWVAGRAIARVSAVV